MKFTDNNIALFNSYGQWVVVNCVYCTLKSIHAGPASALQDDRSPFMHTTPWEMAMICSRMHDHYNLRPIRVLWPTLNC